MPATPWCSIQHDDGVEALGLVRGDVVIDVRAVARRTGLDLPLTLDDALQHGRLASLAVVAAAATEAEMRDASSIAPGRLFRRPGKIVCIGLNYRRHAQEIGMPLPAQPPVFAKFNNTLLAHGGIIHLPGPDVARHFDYETELLVVIGRRAVQVREADALDYVAGYCTANDFSARDLQIGAAGGQWVLSKTLDGFAPIGPHFVPAAAVPDPNRLALKTWVNGELRQSSSTADFIFTVQQIIAYLSKYWPLEPGDLIFTGTPEGVVLGKPVAEQVWLKAGDVVESEIEGLGRLRFALA